MRQKILLFGGQSMLARDFQYFAGVSHDIYGVSRKEADITNFESVLQILASYEPDIVINTAAYTDVDGAEGGGREECFVVNTWGATNVARATSVFGIPLVHISTEYVFDGTKETSYVPSDTAHPLNNYGLSKYLSERYVHQVDPDAVVVRTSSLYGGDISDTHIVSKLIQALKSHQKISLVRGRKISPTSTQDLITGILSLSEQYEQYSGQILHLVNQTSGGISLEVFTRYIAGHLSLEPDIYFVESTDDSRRTLRPQNSVLQNTSPLILRDWGEALSEYLEKRLGL